MARSRDEFEKDIAKNSTRGNTNSANSNAINNLLNPNWIAPKKTNSYNGVYRNISQSASYVDSKSIPTANSEYVGSPTYSSNRALVDMMSDMSDELANHNIVDRYDIEWYTKFNRFGFMDPYNSIKNTREYVFFTKPDLNLFTGYSPNPQLSESSTFFSDALVRYKDVALQLQYSRSSSNGPFIQLLSNSIVGGLELPEISARTVETAKNVYGLGLSYRGGSGGSDNDYDFSLDFKDSRFLEVYMLFKIYDEYERMKWVGQVTPNEEYIRNRILHDQISIYKIIVAEDGMTILYWARAMGCMPLSVPRSSMINLTEDPTYSINWKCQWVKDMDPKILIDFNSIVNDYRSGSSGQLPLFNSTSMTAEGTWARCPYVLTRKNQSTRKEKLNKYYLVWYK